MKETSDTWKSSWMNDLGQDGRQVQVAVEELGRGVARPTEKDRGRVKKLVRLLKGSPRYINHHVYQDAVESIVLWTDPDFVGCTLGWTIKLGTRVITSGSTKRAPVALSSREARYYGTVKGASQTMFSKAFAEDIRMSYIGPIHMNAGASAAVGIGSRLGIGKVTPVRSTSFGCKKKFARARMC